MLKFHIIPYRKKWNKIIDNAFASNDVHVFSEKYIQRRSQLLNKYKFIKKGNQLLKQISDYGELKTPMR